MDRTRPCLSRLGLTLALGLFFVVLPLMVIGVTVCSLAYKDKAVSDGQGAGGIVSIDLEAVPVTLTTPQCLMGQRQRTSAPLLDAWHGPQALELP